LGNSKRCNSWGKSTAGAILPLAKLQLFEGKIATTVLWSQEAKQALLFWHFQDYEICKIGSQQKLSIWL